MVTYHSEEEEPLPLLLQGVLQLEAKAEGSLVLGAAEGAAAGGQGLLPTQNVHEIHNTCMQCRHILHLFFKCDVHFDTHILLRLDHILSIIIVGVAGQCLR